MQVEFGWEKSPSTFAPAFERESDVKDEMTEDRIERIAEGNAWNKGNVFYTLTFAEEVKRLNLLIALIGNTTAAYMRISL